MCTCVDMQQEDNKSDGGGNSDTNVASNCVGDSIEDEVEDKQHENSNDKDGMKLRIYDLCVLSEDGQTKKLPKSKFL